MPEEFPIKQMDWLALAAVNEKQARIRAQTEKLELETQISEMELRSVIAKITGISIEDQSRRKIEVDSKNKKMKVYEPEPEPESS